MKRKTKLNKKDKQFIESLTPAEEEYCEFTAISHVYIPGDIDHSIITYKIDHTEGNIDKYIFTKDSLREVYQSDYQSNMIHTIITCRMADLRNVCKRMINEIEKDTSKYSSISDRIFISLLKSLPEEFLEGFEGYVNPNEIPYVEPAYEFHMPIDGIEAMYDTCRDSYYAANGDIFEAGMMGVIWFKLNNPSINQINDLKYYSALCGDFGFISIMNFCKYIYEMKESDKALVIRHIPIAEDIFKRLEKK